MPKPIIYICGPITSGGGSIADNKARFFKAAELLESKNCVVLHAAGLPLGLAERDYMRISNAMLESANVLYVLPFYEHSMGARSEMAYANKLGLKVIPSTYSASKYSVSLDIGDMNPIQAAKYIKEIIGRVNQTETSFYPSLDGKSPVITSQEGCGFTTGMTDKQMEDAHLALRDEFGVNSHEFGSNSNKGHVYGNEIRPVMSGKNNYD